MFLKIIIVFLSFLITCRANAQDHQERIAETIAGKMTDTLNLTSGQRNQVFAINMRLQNEKMKMRQHYSISDSLTIKVNRVERSRDSLYKPILTETQFQLYKEKKRNLISSN